MNIYQSADLNIKHGFFGRLGGVSQGLFAKSNMGYGRKSAIFKDMPLHVAENRARALSACSIKSPLFVGYQEHTTNIWHIQNQEEICRIEPADALVTSRKDVALGVLTADCGPLILYDEKLPLLAVIHAGWLGAEGGIIQKTLEYMQRQGCVFSDITAVLGPTIAQKDYEVCENFFKNFLKKSAENEVFFEKSSQKYWFSLPLFIKSCFKPYGVRFFDLGLNTFDDAFFSCRRAKKQGEKAFGLNLAIASLEEF